MNLWSILYNGGVATLLLPTKMQTPPLRPALVSRRRLLDRLSNGLLVGSAFSRRLTLITAPAGFGKTTLAVQWLHENALPSVWLSLDESDQDVYLLFSYLAAALTQVAETGQMTRNLLRAPQTAPVRSLATAIVRDMASTEEPFILVLDDYHSVDSVEIATGIGFILDHMPAQVHLVITARAQPKLSVARLRARGQMIEVSERELRFSKEETEVFLRQTMGLALHERAVANLEQRTEGWVAGLQLAAVALQAQGPADDPSPQRVEEFIAAFAGDDQYVMDYLLEEVLRGQAPIRTRFMLETAVLERLNGELCDALTGRDDSRDILEQLQHDNLFLIPLDNRREWYRYHALFAGMLRHRLNRVEPENLVVLHQRASAWFAANDYHDQAIHHALAAGDQEKAAELIEAVGLNFLLRGELAPVQRWLKNLDRQVIVARPELLSIEFGARLTADVMVSDAERFDAELQQAFNSLATMELSERERDRLRGELLVHRATIAFIKREPERALRLIFEAREYTNPDDVFLLAYLHMSLGALYRALDQMDEAEKSWQEGADYAESQDILLITLFCLANLGELYEVQGKLSQAEQIYLRSLRVVTDDNGDVLPMAGLPYLGLAKIARERNELEKASRLMEKSQELGRMSGIQGIVLDGLITTALLERARESYDTAHKALDQAEIILRNEGDAQLKRRLGSIRTRLWLAQGEREKAVAWAKASGLTIDGELTEYAELDYLTLARVLLAEDEPEAAIQLLDRVQAPAEKGQRQARVIESLILRGLALEQMGEHDGAEISISRALGKAEPEGFRRLFADEGEALARLLHRTMAQRATEWPNRLRRYAEELANQIIPEKAKHPPSPSGQPLLEPLTEREQQILRLIAAGMSNQEIAAELFLTVGTVKSYTHQLYGKMGVRRRTEAVDKARELGILP